jgi:hypothetical protein
MCEHFEESRGRDADIFEVMDILLPKFGVFDGLLLGMIVVVQCVARWVNDFFDTVVNLYSYMFSFRLHAKFTLMSAILTNE